MNRPARNADSLGPVAIAVWSAAFAAAVVFTGPWGTAGLVVCAAVLAVTVAFFRLLGEDDDV